MLNKMCGKKCANVDKHAQKCTKLLVRNLLQRSKYITMFDEDVGVFTK